MKRVLFVGAAAAALSVFPLAGPAMADTSHLKCSGPEDNPNNVEVCHGVIAFGGGGFGGSIHSNVRTYDTGTMVADGEAQGGRDVNKFGAGRMCRFDLNPAPNGCNGTGISGP
jgi:hypothetical protein